MATAGVQNLPQMRSIWLDEDEEAEKLYGLQAQQFMAPDDDENLAIMMVNSDKPLLSNKQNIDLPPLGKKSRTPKLLPTAPVVSSQKKKPKKKKGLFSLFKSKDRQVVKSLGHISTPFGFQHISHADVRAGFESDEEKHENEPEEEAESELPSRPLSRAFVTLSIPADVSANTEERQRVSSRMSVQASISTSASSRYSRVSNSAGRIVSSSTMATSVMSEASSPNRIALLSNMDRLCVKNKQNRASEDSEASIGFLKEYDFPTLLENSTVEEQDTLARSDSKKGSPARLSKVSSEPQLFGTPQMENRWFGEDTPASRKSLDDVLLCYHQPSITSSPFQKTPIKSST